MNPSDRSRIFNTYGEKKSNWEFVLGRCRTSDSRFNKRDRERRLRSDRSRLGAQCQKEAKNKRYLVVEIYFRVPLQKSKQTPHRPPTPQCYKPFP